MYRPVANVPVTPKYYPLVPDFLGTEIINSYSSRLESGFDYSPESHEAFRANRAMQQMQSQCLGMLKTTTPHYTPGRFAEAFALSPSSPSSLEVWDLRSSTPRKITWSDSQQRGDIYAKAKRCYLNMSTVDSFFRNRFKRHPVESNGRRMISFIEDFRLFNNAVWDPETEKVYFGTVDPQVFNPLVLDPDVTAHEFGHGFTHFNANFIYFGQSGALNESMSDVFSIMSKHYQKQTAFDQANWDIAERIIVMPRGRSAPLRTFENRKAYSNHPILKSDPQVKHMSGYQKIDYDSGGVHIFSGIPNHAFYLAAEGCKACGSGGSWDVPGGVWFHAAVNAKSNDDFRTFAIRTIGSAREVFGGGDVEQIIGNAWLNVGIDLRIR